MTEISLSSRLPRGDANGLAPIVKSLIAEPEAIHALVILVDTTKIVTDVDDGSTVPVMRIRRIEAVRSDDLAQAERLVRRAWEQRNGSQVLPLEMEDDLKSIFESIKAEQRPDDKDDGADQ